MFEALKFPRLIPVAVFLLAATMAPQCVWSDDSKEAESKDPIVAGQARLNKAMDMGDIEGVKVARALFEKALTDEKIAPVAHYFIGYADSCVAGIQQGKDPEGCAKNFKSAIAHLEKAVKLDAKNADAHAMLGSCYGQMIDVAPDRMMELGPKAQGSMSTAMSLAPKNPRVVLLHGVSTLHTPPQFGGGRELALPILEQAARLFDTHESEDPHEPSWGHDQVYCWLALTYHGMGRKDDAKKALDKAIEINPKSGFAIYYVKPQISGKDDKKEPEKGSGG